MSINIADNNIDEDLRRWIEAQEQTFRTQQEALKNIQQMLAQLLINRNINDPSSNRNEGKYNNDEHLKTDKSKESFSIDAEVINSIQA